MTQRESIRLRMSNRGSITSTLGLSQKENQTYNPSQISVSINNKRGSNIMENSKHKFDYITEYDIDAIVDSKSLKGFLEKCNCSGTEFAKEFEMSRSTISLLLNNKRNITKQFRDRMKLVIVTNLEKANNISVNETVVFLNSIRELKCNKRNFRNSLIEFILLDIKNSDTELYSEMEEILSE